MAFKRNRECTTAACVGIRKKAEKDNDYNDGDDASYDDIGVKDDIKDDMTKRLY